MAESIQAAAPSLPPHVQLIQMGTGGAVANIVHIAAKIGLADKLADGPKTAVELAGPLALHAPSLHRLMRTMASLGLLTEGERLRFSLTKLGEALKSDAPGSARSTLLMTGSSWVASGFANLVHSLQTGRTGFEKAQGMPFFDYLAQHPEDASVFSDAMVGLHGAEPPAVAAAYDFSMFQTVVDVGGASGNMLAAVLGRYPELRGLLFDRPHVVVDAEKLFKAKGVTGRVTVKAGDFFQSVPSGGDAYILSHILHDWNDDQCLTILGHCRKAMKPDGRLLIVEMVLPPGDAPHPGKILDMVMLALIGGQERTETEYASLLHKAGFRLSRVVATQSPVSVIEAVLA
ncbi:methyltransferase [Bradyrhizobium sp. Arg68]|uniref:acetylserotonin O-methyltransferase n=1 Tax=Bradyrhizobium ivorense TaxID=2511166 RepID=UPI001E4538B8|nr:acetylserotonin O-methyltransferase [Bradyrhizobium ivorense]MCC8938693.1 methyltransferase [Bradyrhizobium ivorense]